MNGQQAPTDQSVRDRIIHDLDTSFAVEAAAGTGKTRLLIDRILEVVRTGRARLSEVAAITFTERAAAELKVRLRNEIEKAIPSSQGDTAARLRDALADLDSAHVSTIHSFAADILRQRPVEAHIDPGFDIAEALTADLLFDEVWTRWLAQQLSDENSGLRPALAANVRLETLAGIARFLRANPDLKVAGEVRDVRPEIEALVAAFVPKTRSLHSDVQERCDATDCTCLTRISQALIAADRMDGVSPDEVAAVLPAINVLVKNVRHATCTPAMKDECKRRLEELQDIVDAVRPAAVHNLVSRLVSLLREAIVPYEAEKRKQALLDFDDLLLRARDVVRDNLDVRRDFQSRFKFILVDECQDSDPLQIELVMFLAEDGAHASRWQDVRVAPGKLLFVGDPKQSIYRFRRADIEVYEEAKRTIARSGEVVEISQNFRSAAPCIHWVNAVFAELIRRPEDGNYQPDYVALHAWREGPSPAVTILRPREGQEFGVIGEAREAEAAAVAAEIRERVRRGDLVFDRNSGTSRPAQYGDFTILFRKRTALPIYTDTLGAFDIPFRSLSGKDFFARQEVVALRVVLAAVERPHDPVAVVAALRSPLLGVSDEELAQFGAGGFNYLTREREAGESYIAQAFRLLASWHRARNSMSISALVRRVLADTKALELFFLRPGGEQRAANLNKLLDEVRAYEATPGATFGGCVRWLKQMSTAAEEGESLLAHEEGNFVKLMTTHQAKGLEFPIVILADISAHHNPSENYVVNRTAGTFDLQVGAQELGLYTIGLPDAREREARRGQAEERRLFYVAATRARDYLILPFFPGGRSGECIMEYVEGLVGDAAAAAGALVNNARPVEGGAEPVEPKAFRVDLSHADRRAWGGLVAARKKWVEERESLLRSASHGRRLAAASELPELEEHWPEAGERTRRAAIGTAVHGVLEHIDLSSGGNLRELAEIEATANGIADLRGEVEQLARAALDSELVRRAAAATRCHREIPFALTVGDTILEGVIDLAFEDDDGIHIVDYKTDDVDEGGLAAHATGYRLQVGAYALAAEQVFRRPPRSVSLLFLRRGREVTVDVSPALLKSVRERCDAISSGE